MSPSTLAAMQTYVALALAVGSLWFLKLFIAWRAAVNSIQYVVVRYS